MIKLPKLMTAQELEGLVIKLAGELSLDVNSEIYTKKFKGQISEYAQFNLCHKDAEKKPKDHWGDWPATEGIALIVGEKYSGDACNSINQTQIKYDGLTVHRFACGCSYDIDGTLSKIIEQDKAKLKNDFHDMY